MDALFVKYYRYSSLKKNYDFHLSENIILLQSFRHYFDVAMFLRINRAIHKNFKSLKHSDNHANGLKPRQRHTF